VTGPEPTSGGQGEHHRRKTDKPPKDPAAPAPRRESAVVRKLLSGTQEKSAVIPPQVYELINEIINFTHEVNDRSRETS
jgi:hypothetical protein